jgi:hypothetical protein
MATIAVISLVVLAGGSRRFGFLEKRISPVDASTVMAARELIFSAKQFEERRMKTKGNKTKQHKKAPFRSLSGCPTQEVFLNSIRRDIKTASLATGKMVVI